MPMRRAVRITRQAISPRFAIRIFLNMSERDIRVLAPRVRELLVLQHRERPADPPTRLARHDNVVDVAAVSGDERVGELLSVLLGALGDLLWIAEVLAENDLHRALRPHYRDLGRRPREVDVAAQVLRAHDVVGPTVRLARDHGYLRHRRLGVGEQELRAVLDDAAVLLRGSRQKTGY